MSPLRYLFAMAILLPAAGALHQGAAPQARPPEAREGVYLVIRSDDAGMSHAVNSATKKLLQAGLPVSVSIMFPCPWYREIVEILREYPQASVGAHLTLNSEWRNYRWGPVVGREAAPTLVDEDGYFFPSSADLHENEPDPSELERELRAQIDRALATGLRIDYLDFHMGTATRYPEFRAIVERLASEYGLGLSGDSGEQRHDPQYWAEPEAKLDSLLAMVERLEPGYHVLITHPGENTPELAALVDMNVDHPLENMSAHRQGELDALTSEAFAEALLRHGVTPITYRDLFDMVRVR
jgi:predicted glycoside hydrolase/deacetylase ChbG (UPF0249 family)